jgi:hypothetical protein
MPSLEVIMPLSTRLRYEKTLRANKNVTTFNSPGTYQVPYGRGLVKVGGRGGSGNAPTGGTVANYNPPTPGNIANYNAPIPGNYAGTNPASGGNAAGYNPVVPGNSVTNPGNYVPASYTPGNTNPGSYTNGNYVPESTSEVDVAMTQNCPSGWDTGYSYDDLGKPYKVCTITNPAYTNPGTYTPGNTNPGNYAPAYTNPPVTNYNPPTGGNLYYNPYYPATPYYNPTTPGNANYNPDTPGNANYNPVVPGNVGQTVTVAGVTLPGGAIGSLAPTISPAPSTMSYVANGVPINVGPGGYVTITPI